MFTSCKIIFLFVISWLILTLVNAGIDDALFILTFGPFWAKNLENIQHQKNQKLNEGQLKEIAKKLEETDKSPCFLPFVNFPDKEPVFLDSNYELIKPVGFGIFLLHGQVINLACTQTGRGTNFLIASNNALTSAECVRNTVLRISGVEYELSTLNCRQTVGGHARMLNQVCANGMGKHVEIGHEINENHFLSLITGCYDSSRGAALFTEHTIYGSAIRYGKATPRRPAFKPGDTDIGFNPEAYSQRRQKQYFENEFGQDQNYINSGSYLAKGHLSPDADFVYITSKFATYFYVNVVPQWQQDINNRNWKTLETAVRNFAADQNLDLKVISGSYDVLKLNGKSIYLDNGNLPAPALTWKVVQIKETKQAIGFITLNNAFDPTDVARCCLCSDIAKQYGWHHVDYNNYRKGVTYACDVNEMRRVIPTIPDVQHTGILVGPNPIQNTVQRYIHDELRRYG